METFYKYTVTQYFRSDYSSTYELDADDHDFVADGRHVEFYKHIDSDCNMCIEGRSHAKSRCTKYVRDIIASFPTERISFFINKPEKEQS